MLSNPVRLGAAVLSRVTASLLIAATTASAQEPVVVYGEPEHVRTERVSYADLDLAQRGDEKKLVRRVSGAVKRVCLFDNDRHGLQDSSYQRCSDGAWNGARPQIAQAVARAQEMALTGKSSIAVAAISISVPAQ